MSGDLARFTNAYIECALWSSSDDDGNNFDDDRLSDETRTRMEADCAKFVEEWRAVLDACEEAGNQGDTYKMAGHDFWLTRNGHGAGFWDGDWDFAVTTAEGKEVPDVAKLLTRAAKTFGEYDLYVGDDGQVYGFPPEKATVAGEVER